MQQFTADVDSHKYRNRVQMEEKQGEDAAVGGTPTFFINGKKYNGIWDVATVAPADQEGTDEPLTGYFERTVRFSRSSCLRAALAHELVESSFR